MINNSKIIYLFPHYPNDAYDKARHNMGHGLYYLSSICDIWFKKPCDKKRLILRLEKLYSILYYFSFSMPSQRLAIEKYIK